MKVPVVCGVGESEQRFTLRPVDPAVVEVNLVLVVSRAGYQALLHHLSASARPGPAHPRGFILNKRTRTSTPFTLNIVVVVVVVGSW